MKVFNVHRGKVVPLDRANVDTDAIIPKQFLKSIKRSGFGPNLFDEWRYLDVGEPGKDNSKRPLNPDFVLNQPRYAGASILVARENFGFRCIIAPSFADIFYNNCFKNGLLPLRMTEAQVSRIFDDVKAFVGYELIIDLPEQVVRTTQGEVIGSFEIDAFRKNNLLNGLDEIGLTLQHADDIRAYEERRFRAEPWLQASLGH